MRCYTWLFNIHKHSCEYISFLLRDMYESNPRVSFCDVLGLRWRSQPRGEGEEEEEMTNLTELTHTWTLLVLRRSISTYKFSKSMPLPVFQWSLVRVSIVVNKRYIAIVLGSRVLLLHCKRKIILFLLDFTAVCEFTTLAQRPTKWRTTTALAKNTNLETVTQAAFCANGAHSVLSLVPSLYLQYNTEKQIYWRSEVISTLLELLCRKFSWHQLFGFFAICQKSRQIKWFGRNKFSEIKCREISPFKNREILKLSRKYPKIFKGIGILLFSDIDESLICLITVV